MFRKFFYENSAPIEDMLTFVEVTNSRLAHKLGLKDKDQVVIVQNKNRYTSSSFPVDFKLVNLELQRSEPFTEILNETIKSRLGEDLMNELTQEELVQELIHSDEN